MPRLVLAALVTGIALACGGAVWFHHALDSAFARGRAAGVLETEAAYRGESDRRRSATDAALIQSNKEAVALERQRHVLQEKLNEVIAAASRSALAGRACLDADIVRALEAAGGAAGVPARP